MTAMASDPQHVVTRAVASLRAEVSGLAGVPVWSMSAAETASGVGFQTVIAAVDPRLIPGRRTARVEALPAVMIA